MIPGEPATERRLTVWRESLFQSVPGVYGRRGDILPDTALRKTSGRQAVSKTKQRRPAEGVKTPEVRVEKRSDTINA